MASGVAACGLKELARQYLGSSPSRFTFFTHHCEAALHRPNKEKTMSRNIEGKVVVITVRAAVSERAPLATLPSWALRSFSERGVRIVSTRL